MLTWRLVVADGHIWWNIRCDIGKTLWTIVGSTADLGGSLPDDLREVAPVVEVGHVWLTLAKIVTVPVLFAVVEQLGDNDRDVVGCDTCCDVLTITTNLVFVGRAILISMG